MIATTGVRDVFRKRARITSVIRRLLEDEDFLEVETPVLEATAGVTGMLMGRHHACCLAASLKSRCWHFYTLEVTHPCLVGNSRCT